MSKLMLIPTSLMLASGLILFFEGLTGLSESHAQDTILGIALIWIASATIAILIHKGDQK